MSGRRWFVIATLATIGGGLPVAWQRLAHAAHADRARTPLQIAEDAVSRAGTPVYRLQYALANAMLRDSIVTVLGARQWPVDSLLVLADSTMPAWRRARTDSLLRRDWRRVLPADGRVRVVALVVRSRSFTVPREGFRTARSALFLLPAAVDGRTCVAVVTHGEASMSDSARRGPMERDPRDTSVGVGSRMLSNSGRWLGPCAYLAAFGPPGEHIRAWLDSSSWSAAQLPNWSVRADSLLDWSYRDLPRTLSLAEQVGRAMAMRRYWSFSRSDAAAVRCAAGRLADCVLYGQHPGRFAATPQDGVGAVNGVGYLYGLPLESTRGALDPVPRLLADMVRREGREKFARFWRDSSSFATAMNSAFSAPAGEWLHDWLLTRIAGPEIVGPRVATRTVVSAAMLIGLFLALCAAHFSRRQGR